MITTENNDGTNNYGPMRDDQRVKLSSMLSRVSASSSLPISGPVFVIELESLSNCLCFSDGCIVEARPGSTSAQAVTDS